MPAPQDAVFLATQHLMDTLEPTFFDNHPFFQKVLEGGDVQKITSSGEFARFEIIVDGPGNISKQITGGEAYAYGRRNIAREGRVFVPTHVYAFAIEAKLLTHGMGETGIANLLKLYPEMAMMDFQQRCTAQVLTGNGAAANADGWTTLNGDATYNPDGTALNGLFDFAAPAAQADVVENIAKSSTVSFWYNQYGLVASFTTGGKRILRDAYNQASMRSPYRKPPTIMFSDSVSFNNYYDTLDDQVRYGPQGSKGEAGYGQISDGLMFKKAEWFTDPSIDDGNAQFGHTTNGTTYGISPESFGLMKLGFGKQDGVDVGKGWFEVQGPFKLEGRRAWGFEIITCFQPFCRNLKANFAVEGTAIL